MKNNSGKFEESPRVRDMYMINMMDMLTAIKSSLNDSHQLSCKQVLRLPQMYGFTETIFTLLGPVCCFIWGRFPAHAKPT